MNIQQLEYLIAVDKYKHFGKAAQACFVTQPTLSAMIQKLEDELDLKIFDRTTHPIRTTDVGMEVIEHSKNIVDSVNELKNKANFLNNILGGRLNLGIIPTVSSYILPTQIFSFLTENPKIELTVKEMATENIIKALKSGELDAGIIATPYREAKDFYGDVLFNEELMVYSSNGNDVNKYIAPEEIKKDQIWLLEEGNCLRTQLEHICHLKENTLKPKNLDFFGSNIGTLVHMVDSIGGVTVLPELAIDQLSMEQQEKITRFKKPFPYREVSIIYYKPTYKQKIIDELVCFIRESLEPKMNYNKAPKDFVSVNPE